MHWETVLRICVLYEDIRISDCIHCADVWYDNQIRDRPIQLHNKLYLLYNTALYSYWTLELHIILDSPVETDVEESLSSAWQTTDHLLGQSSEKKAWSKFQIYLTFSV